MYVHWSILPKNVFLWALSSQVGVPHRPFWYICIAIDPKMVDRTCQKGNFRGRSTQNGRIDPKWSIRPKMVDRPNEGLNYHIKASVKLIEFVRENQIILWQGSCSCSFPVSSQFLIHISFISIFHFFILYSRTTIITRRHGLKQIRFFINIMLPNFRNSRTINSNTKSQI